MIGEVLVLRKCYQCGGETLGPMVKHSVRDSTVEGPAIEARNRFSFRYRIISDFGLSDCCKDVGCDAVDKATMFRGIS